MQRKVRVGAVSYLNTKPLLYGIEKQPFIDEIELTLEYPSIIAKQLRENTIDIGLVPVSAIPEIQNAEIVSDYGIAADGHVASVSIFSKKPIEEIKRVYLDYQSRTSVKLAETLLKHYWKMDVEFLPAPENYIELISANIPYTRYNIETGANFFDISPSTTVTLTKGKYSARLY